MKETVVKMERDCSGIQKLIWVAQDKTGNVGRSNKHDESQSDTLRGYERVMTQPASTHTADVSETTGMETHTRIIQAVWLASKYTRLLHVLNDARMTLSRQQLLCPLTRENLDTVTADPGTSTFLGSTMT